MFDFDYWPLELAKLATAPAPRILAGYVAIVLAMDTPYANAIVARLARDGAHVIVAGRDEQSSEATILLQACPLVPLSRQDRKMRSRLQLIPSAAWMCSLQAKLYLKWCLRKWLQSWALSGSVERWP